MPAPRSIWYMPFALFIACLLFYVSVGRRFNEWIATGFELEHERTNALSSVLSPETVDALYGDARLHAALLQLMATAAKASSDYGESYNSVGLKDFGINLTKEIARLKAAIPQKKKRGTSDVMASGGNVTGEIGALFSSLGGHLAEGLAMPALFLGVGLGMGIETGLNLTDVETSTAKAKQVATSYNVSTSGLNTFAQNLGSGITAQMAPSLKNLANGDMLGAAAYALAQGIGQSCASGMNLTQQKFQPSSGIDAMAIANNFGLGIAGPIFSSLNVGMIVSKVMGTGQIYQVSQITAAAGHGLGKGAAAAFGFARQVVDSNMKPLSKRQAPEDSNQFDIPGAVEDFTRGLSESFLQLADPGKVFGSIAPPGGLYFDAKDMMVPLAAGAGKGIGGGLSIGFGFKPDVEVASLSNRTNTSKQAETAAEEFTKGLISRFLLNSTAPGVMSNMAQNAFEDLTVNISGAQAAEGLARGLIEGSINAFSMAGGIQNVLSGSFSADLAANLPAMAPTKFNDSTNGAAVAFGRGLAGQGTLLVASMLSNMSKNSSPPSKRSVDTNEIGVVPHKSLVRRADVPALAFDAETLSSIAQFGANKLTCQGFGGIAAVALGLMNSGTLQTDSSNSTPFDNSTLAALPNGPIVITYEGNKFEITIPEGEITINSIQLMPFAILTGLHILFTTLAFFYALPAYMALGALHRLSTLTTHPFNEAKTRKWRNILLLYFFTPTALTGITLGIISKGTSSHFTTPHGILGLTTLLLTLPTIIASLLRLNTTSSPPPPHTFTLKSLPPLLASPHKIHPISALLTNITLTLSSLAWTQGWSALRTASLCIVDAMLTAPVLVAALSAVFGVFFGGQVLVGLRVWVEGRLARGEEGSMGRSDTIRTFGFGPRDGPVREWGAGNGDGDGIGDEMPTTAVRDAVLARDTKELVGQEDSRIGWPSGVRKEGSEVWGWGGETVGVRSVDNPFVDPGEGAEWKGRGMSVTSWYSGDGRGVAGTREGGEARAQVQYGGLEEGRWFGGAGDGYGGGGAGHGGASAGHGPAYGGGGVDHFSRASMYGEEDVQRSYGYDYDGNGRRI